MRVDDRKANTRADILPCQCLEEVCLPCPGPAYDINVAHALFGIQPYGAVEVVSSGTYCGSAQRYPSTRKPNCRKGKDGRAVLWDASALHSSVWWVKDSQGL